MKYLLLSILLLPVFLLNSCDVDDPPDDPDDNDTINTTAIVNGSFELWTMESQNNVEFETPGGGYWASLNNLVFLGGPLVATKTTNSHTGSYALHLEAKAWGDDWVIPGIIAAGIFDSNQTIGENLVMGRAITVEPTSISMYYRYLPADNDTAVIYSSLTKYNQNLQRRDTIAEAYLTIVDVANEYTHLVLPFEYRSALHDHDTINIIFLTSISGDKMKAHEGSILEVDDIELIVTE
ncbi:MAG: PCMD domain-containing protein [Bacteroidales bacterium]|nr:PCMD domain-containing protein [Bacteroidales bacterium]HOY38044.1 PCMD domain-containing protein [Bacteroidales bacterium]HQP03210.1 PCMD domain-containing protein [Bacteroidales bacterium]